MYLILLATSWTLACQAPLSMGFPRQENWSALLFPSLGDLPNPGIKPASPALAGRSFTTEPPDYAPTHSRWVRPTLQVQVSGSPHKLFPLTGIPSPPFPSMLAEIHLHLKDLDSMPLASPPNNHETFQDRCSFPSFPVPSLLNSPPSNSSDLTCCFLSISVLALIQFQLDFNLFVVPVCLLPWMVRSLSQRPHLSSLHPFGGRC